MKLNYNKLTKLQYHTGTSVYYPHTKLSETYQGIS
jgi:hypothetical protein